MVVWVLWPPLIVLYARFYVKCCAVVCSALCCQLVFDFPDARAKSTVSHWHIGVAGSQGPFVAAGLKIRSSAYLKLALSAYHKLALSVCQHLQGPHSWVMASYELC